MQTTHRSATLILFALAVLALAACGGGQPPSRAEPTPMAIQPMPTASAVAEPETDQPAAALAALTIPCAELVPANELERMIGAKPDSLMDTVMRGWTACNWFYTQPAAGQQSEFTVQVYTGEDTLVKWRMDTANRPAEFVVNSLADYVQEGYTWVIPESNLRAVQALQDGRYVFLRFPADNLALAAESSIADYLHVLFQRLQEKG